MLWATQLNLCHSIQCEWYSDNLAHTPSRTINKIRYYGAPPAGPAGAPLLPQLWYLVHSCRLPYLMYTFLFNFIHYSISQSTLMYVYIYMRAALWSYPYFNHFGMA